MVSASTPTVGHFPVVSPVVLVTGFEPFDGQTINPSWMAVQAMHGRQIAGHRVVGAQLPCVFDRSLQVLREQMRKHRPALVIATGQAGGRGALSLERVAINVNDARIPDNVQAQPIDTPVVSGAPDAYFTSLPIKAMLAAMLEEGITAEVSQTAGTFVCNHVFYGLMHELATRAALRGVRGGFVHVPWLPDQGQPSMGLEEIVAGLKVAIRCAVETKMDIKRQAGALD